MWLKGLNEVSKEEVGKVEEVGRVYFENADINYLTFRHELEPKVVGKMLRTFGEQVVLEALRRFAGGSPHPVRNKEAWFVGICRGVKNDEGKED